MPSLAVSRCLFRLMRHCFLGRWICLPVSERFRLVWRCRLFDYSTYSPFCVHWHGGQFLQRLVPNYAVLNILRKNQNSFRRNRSTTSQILTIRRILEGVRAKNLQATLLFVDFTKAFVSIHRGKMEQILLAYGLPKKKKKKNVTAIKIASFEFLFAIFLFVVF